MKRESFRSRLGFLLVSAGCAIGIGNVWRFPYIAGKNGGGYFVLFYLLCLLVMGVPVLTMELAVGRASRRSAVLSYKTLEKPGQKWHIHGWFCLLGCYLLMMYYTTVSGWMVSYFGKFLTGAFHSGMSTDEVASAFGAMLSSPGEMALWAEVVVVAGFLVCSFGLQKGLERVTKVMMLCLLALILVLAVHSLTLSGAAEGMKFYLVPSMDSIRENGFGSLVTDAMNQAFFTLSLGIAAMEIFGSYMSDEHTLPGEAVRICALDTFVALMAGTIIFPACFSFGVNPGQGPGLVFVTLPNIFGGGAVNIFLIRQFMRGIPRELENAAKIDGANVWQIFWRIMIPLCMPIITFIMVNTFIGVWNDFMGPLIYLQGNPDQYTLAVGIYYKFMGGLAQENFPNQQMAVGVLMSIPPAILFFIFQKQLIEGVTMSGLKG